MMITVTFLLRLIGNNGRGWGCTLPLLYRYRLSPMTIRSRCMTDQLTYTEILTAAFPKMMRETLAHLVQSRLFLPQPRSAKDSKLALQAAVLQESTLLRAAIRKIDKIDHKSKLFQSAGNNIIRQLSRAALDKRLL